MDLVFPALGTFIYMSYPWNGKLFITVHNAALHLFSLWTCVSLCYYARQHDMKFQSGYYLSDSRIERLVFYFYLSKYYEYLDTFILYAQGKAPIFLQKYHHVGAVICWHLAWRYKLDSIIVASAVNAFIHTLMYLYYLLTLYKVDVRFIKPYLTYLQIMS
jgi:hypothetical protein